MGRAMSAQATLRPSALSMACSQLESYPDVSVSPEALLTPGVLRKDTLQGTLQGMLSVVLLKL